MSSSRRCFSPSVARVTRGLRREPPGRSGRTPVVAWSRVSCAARSAETSVDRRSSSSSRCFEASAWSSSSLVGEVGAFAPDVLEAVGDVGEQPLDDPAAVAAEPRSAKLHMSDLYWGERHRTSLQKRPDHEVHELGRNEQDDDGDDRREVDRSQRRDAPPEQPKVRADDFVQELLHSRERAGVGNPHPDRSTHTKMSRM